MTKLRLLESLVDVDASAHLFDAISKIVVAYLLGSVLGSLVIGKIRGGVDIRKLGSGNAGGTNALRTQGKWFAIGVMFIDVGKGWIAASLLPIAPLFDAAPSADWLPLACATSAVLGHVYPVWYGFRGGKGAATLVGVVLGILPTAVPVVLVVWLVVLLATGYVGLATMLATASFPLYTAATQASIFLMVFGLLMTVFVTFTHRGNIVRMVRGVEHRSQRLWLLKPR